MNTNFLNHISGAAMAKAAKAVETLNASIEVGYWVNRGGTTVMPAIGNSAKLKKLGRELASACHRSTPDYFGLPEYRVAFSASYGNVDKVAEALKNVDVAELSAETKELVEAIAAIAADYTEVLAAIAELNENSEANRAVAKAKEAGKVVGVCACCFRAQVVQPSGTMYKHGYKRPGYGFLVGGCPGSDFAPYSV